MRYTRLAKRLAVLEAKMAAILPPGALRTSGSVVEFLPDSPPREIEERLAALEEKEA
jgi:hypothetical protein